MKVTININMKQVKRTLYGNLIPKMCQYFKQQSSNFALMTKDIHRGFQDSNDVNKYKYKYRNERENFGIVVARTTTEK